MTDLGKKLMFSRDDEYDVHVSLFLLSLALVRTQVQTNSLTYTNNKKRKKKEGGWRYLVGNTVAHFVWEKGCNSEFEINT